MTEPFKDAHISFEKQKTINESKPPTENESPPAAQDAQKSKMAALAASQAISDSKQYQAPNSLDLFALETRARRTIGELIRPIIQELDSDRRKVAEVSSKQDRVNQRLMSIEYILGLSETKPKIFEDLEDKIANNKALIAENANETSYRLELMQQTMSALDSDMKSCVADMKSLDSLIRMRDTETAESNKAVELLKIKLNQETNRIEDMINNLGFTFNNKLTSFEA